jgi:penicillin-binding protein 1A
LRLKRPPPPSVTEPQDFVPASRQKSRLISRAVAALIGLLIFAIAWLAWNAPLSRALEPLPTPTLVLMSSDGKPIARRGAVKERPVSAETLPRRVTDAFVAIEDRRFYRHPGIDVFGIARAAWRNMRAGGVVEGGSTITQQLAKTAFLSPDQNMKRKLQEVLIAFWMEAWLSKEEILSRYLSSIYFGDSTYGLRAASRHYFSVEPERLTLAQAAMLAGIVKAPSRLAPTNDLASAQRRSRLVTAAMVDNDFISPEVARQAGVATLRLGGRKLPQGTYFADWAARQARDAYEMDYGETRVVTTLDARLQRQAVRAITTWLDRSGKRLNVSQAALVAMRPDGRVVAMVGGRSYARSPFNRATQARRQPGSAFKLFVFLSAIEKGFTPTSLVEDEPLEMDGWAPENADRTYRGVITIREAFARSSNVAAVRLSEAVGRDAVIRTARRLGVSAPLVDRPSLALGTSGVTLLEMTAAYAAIAGGRYPVRARGLPDARDGGWRARFFSGQRSLGQRRFWPSMLDLLWAATNEGTGKAAALQAPSFGKTGTTQDHRDALFIGFAGDLVTGVWVGNDDNSATNGVTGGGLPAQIWHDFMNRVPLTEPGAEPRRELPFRPAPQRKTELEKALSTVGEAEVGDAIAQARKLAERMRELQAEFEGLGNMLSQNDEPLGDFGADVEPGREGDD